MNEDGTNDSDDTPRRDHLAVTGRVDARPYLVGRVLKADWLCRTLYNAARDRHVPFAEGFAYRHALSEARHHNLKLPDEPTKSDRFLPVPKMQDLQPILVHLRARYSDLSEFAYSTQWEAIDDAIKAVAKHVAACVEAKAAGAKLPDLGWRSASDDVDVVTSAFRVIRSGDGKGHTRPKVGKAVTRTTRKNRKARAKRKLRKTETYRAEKRRLGWSDGRIEYGLRLKSERADRDRVRNAAKAKEPKPAGRARSDSPKAIIGEDVVDLEVKGIGRMRVRLDRELPEDSRVVEVHLVKTAGTTSRLEVRLVLSVPRAAPLYDELATGALIHSIVKHLPLDASPMDAVEAVRAATALPIGGDDMGLTNASADDTGRTTKLAKVSRREIESLARTQKALAWKDQCARQAAEAKGVKKARRSNKAKDLHAKLTRMGRTAKDRQRTAALTDAKRLVTGNLLVATDTLGMTRLLAKGGPADRRKARLEGRPLPMPPVVARRADGSLVFLKPKDWCTMRRNMHSLSPATRVRRVGFLCERVGAIHAKPGEAGTTAGCPKCRAKRKKGLGEREHVCSTCGLRMPRDKASALFSLGEALLEYRVGPDPGGRVAARRARRAEADAKADALHERRVLIGKKGGAARGAALKARGLSRGVDRACGPGPHETRGGTSGGTALVQAHAVSN